ncbi:MAG: hypothetical protein UT84_C0031G0008 [Candidatus Curtissbacteria bacterium GW2011_GWA1_40_16]|uniref:Uncharacterized protein n=1 Tax=Candidatus Curtissbacteria bacterium GW2011_GWA1_40_16 TaxID=1618405 RepID=A0A0G0RAD2_9BACT|nr:MAG: hypothetical protein UT84_C0031G0008 [Candidatus Curtissbacteria bacterium GW2011_GWA1_40_16]
MKDLLIYIWKNKNWWILPPVIIIIIVGIFIFITSASPISPFIYMLF